MSLLEICILSIGLGMDAFAVSVCKGLSMKKMNWKKSFIIAEYFGLFQAAMPIIGYVIGKKFEGNIKSYDHWITLVLLLFIGIKMIKESLNGENEKDDSIKFKTMFYLAIATSIDALAVGITLAFLNTSIILAASVIGIITFILSASGVKIGNVFGDKYEKNAQVIGGILLILIGIKVLLEHL